MSSLKAPVLLLISITLAMLTAPTLAFADRALEPSRPKVAILVSISAPGVVASSFGAQGTDEIAARTSLMRALAERGFEVVSAAGTKVTRVATAEEAKGELLADASAADLARELGAGIAVIIGLEGVTDGPIRGTGLDGGVANGATRVLNVSSGRVVHESAAEGAGWGESVDAAVDSALRNAAQGFTAKLAAVLAKAWPADLPQRADRMSVSVRGAKSWGAVSAIIRRLATTKGISAVHPSSIRGGEVTLVLETSLSAKKVVSSIRAARLVRGSMSVKASAGGVAVSVSGD